MAQHIVSHRKVLGVTQKEFARQLGIDRTTLARWERGERMPEAQFLTCLQLQGFRTPER